MKTSVIFLLVLYAFSVICSENQTEFSPDLRRRYNDQHHDHDSDSDKSSQSLQDQCSRPSSCADIFIEGKKRSGVYTIYPRQWMNARPFQVYCDMETDGGGWTVFQRRDDNWNFPEVNFTRTWNDYRKGFGDLRDEFWLGNDRIHVLTSQDRVLLRIELEDWNGGRRYANYDLFTVDNAQKFYQANFGSYSGTAGSTFQNGYQFGTYDSVHACSSLTTGGWWYYPYYNTYYCKGSMNGIYYRTNITNRPDGIVYNGYKQNYSLKKSEMKLRPSYFRTYAPMEPYIKK